MNEVANQGARRSSAVGRAENRKAVFDTQSSSARVSSSNRHIGVRRYVLNCRHHDLLTRRDSRIGADARCSGDRAAGCRVVAGEAGGRAGVCVDRGNEDRGGECERRVSARYESYAARAVADRTGPHVVDENGRDSGQRQRRVRRHRKRAAHGGWEGDDGRLSTSRDRPPASLSTVRTCRRLARPMSHFPRRP